MLFIQQIHYTFRHRIPSSGEFAATYNSGYNEMLVLSNEQSVLINHEGRKVLKLKEKSTKVVLLVWILKRWIACMTSGSGQKRLVG
jgi:hypothetical protein